MRNLRNGMGDITQDVQSLTQTAQGFVSEAQSALSSFQIQSPNPDYVHFAYLLMGLGALSLVGDPKKLVSLVSGIYLYSNLVNKSKASLVTQ